MFADNAVIWTAEENFDRAEAKIKVAVGEVDEFMKINKLKLNVEKTKCMSMGVVANCNLFIDGIAIEQVNVIKYIPRCNDRRKTENQRQHKLRN